MLDENSRPVSDFINEWVSMLNPELKDSAVNSKSKPSELQQGVTNEDVLNVGGSSKQWSISKEKFSELKESTVVTNNPPR